MNLRIVSLVPSLTELAIDLGLGPWLVGRTGFCIHPAQAVAGIPKVGGTKTVNLRRIRALQPSHVLVNIDENRREDVEALREFVPHIVVTHPCGPRDNLALLDQMEAAFGQGPAGERVAQAAADLRGELARRLARLAGQTWPQQQVLYLIWREPWMTVARDTYISQMLSCVGWHTLPDVAGGPSGAARYPVLDWREPWLGMVRQVLLSSEPYSFGPQHEDEVRQYLPQARVRQVDGELLSWYGSRALRGLDYLAELAQAG